MEIGNGKFQMVIDEKKKVLIAFAEGLFSMEQGKKFTEEFISTAKKLNSGEYSLLIDVKGVRPSNPQVEKALGDVMGLYVSDDFKFKKRFMTKLSSAIAQAQIQKLAETIPGFTGKMVFVADKDEAYHKL